MKVSEESSIHRNRLISLGGQTVLLSLVDMTEFRLVDVVDVFIIELPSDVKASVGLLELIDINFDRFELDGLITEPPLSEVKDLIQVPLLLVGYFGHDHVFKTRPLVLLKEVVRGWCDRVDRICGLLLLQAVDVHLVLQVDVGVLLDVAPVHPESSLP